MKKYDYLIEVVFNDNGFIEIECFEYYESNKLHKVGYTTTSAFIGGEMLSLMGILGKIDIEKFINKCIPRHSTIKVETKVDIADYHASIFKAKALNLVSKISEYLNIHLFYETDEESVLYANEKEALAIIDYIKRLYRLFKLKINVIPMYEIDDKNRYYFTGSVDGFNNGNITISKVVSYDSENINLESNIGNIIVKLIDYDDHDGNPHCKFANIFQCRTVLFDSVEEILMALESIVEEGENKVILAASSSLDGKINQYSKYIQDHCNKVITGFNKYGEALCEAVGADYGKVHDNIQIHDASKTTAEEFDAYRVKFYTVEGETFGLKEELNFQKAWLHHIHNNPHHPEYWILTGTDDGIDKVLDMDPEYIVEMILDWDTFKKDGKGGAYDYYFVQGHKKVGLLSDKTRALLEKGLQVVK